MRQATQAEIRAAFPAVPIQRFTEIYRHTYISTDGVLCKRASSATALRLIARGENLPTRISQNAADVLAGLRELTDAGLLVTAQTHLYDQAPGVRVETTPQILDFGEILTEE
jgi:hypothetical protein